MTRRLDRILDLFLIGETLNVHAMGGGLRLASFICISLQSTKPSRFCTIQKAEWRENWSHTGYLLRRRKIVSQRRRLHLSSKMPSSPYEGVFIALRRYLHKTAVPDDWFRNKSGCEFKNYFEFIVWWFEMLNTGIIVLSFIVKKKWFANYTNGTWELEVTPTLLYKPLYCRRNPWGLAWIFLSSCRIRYWWPSSWGISKAAQSN